MCQVLTQRPFTIQQDIPIFKVVRVSPQGLTSQFGTAARANCVVYGASTVLGADWSTKEKWREQPGFGEVFTYAEKSGPAKIFKTGRPGFGVYPTLHQAKRAMFPAGECCILSGTIPKGASCIVGYISTGLSLMTKVVELSFTNVRIHPWAGNGLRPRLAEMGFYVVTIYR